MGESAPEKYPQIKTITDQERIRMVKEIFSTITGKYDFLNRFLSLRRDVAWRKFAAKKMRFFRTNRYLDVACGTGDLSIAAAEMHPGIKVTGIDFVPEMVEAAKEKVRKKNLAGRITLMQGDALQLPFEDSHFDVTGIAFGIRNIPDRTRALSEMLRVTVPGGQVMVLEMTFVQNRFFKLIYYVYLNYLLPAFAKLFSKNPAAYYYLADSIMNFPSPGEFAKLMEEAGMVDVQKYPLTFGITWLHVGKKVQG
ncbi:MAG: bifunctional demethylmenaquinone methyltransferase/2-methoxy-6-polyprenyl-1,4-benzoquinol methylase UbiE [Deltaproteobacteria bacterium HGW-Deltaproteobacteria-6]|jgi:demethylmenaquinone methyltransferase/2-methoxy-6-polyprenyl-1,4-benzoquinol methylase|nr:MAG: bifunctional demethylmenaquinone methyltransferase/2-methoxy-6-polyprenyl-1,4-benzoquinol methylase UbiE [Deltaproteobacteria bacterium HGW-Deltaproteobacteria-6]